MKLFTVFFDTYHIRVKIHEKGDKIGDLYVEIMSKLNLEPEQIVSIIHDRGILGKDISFDESIERLVYSPVAYCIVDHFPKIKKIHKGTQNIFMEWLDHQIENEDESVDGDSETGEYSFTDEECSEVSEPQDFVCEDCREHHENVSQETSNNSSSQQDPLNNMENLFNTLFSSFSQSPYANNTSVNRNTSNNSTSAGTANSVSNNSSRITTNSNVTSPMPPTSTTAPVTNSQTRTTTNNSNINTTTTHFVNGGNRNLGNGSSSRPVASPPGSFNIDALLSALGPSFGLPSFNGNLNNSGQGQSTISTTTTSPDGEVRHSMVSFEIGSDLVPVGTYGASGLIPRSSLSSGTFLSGGINDSNGASFEHSLMAMLNNLNGINGTSGDGTTGGTTNLFDGFMNILNNLEDVPVTLDPETINKIPEFKYEELKEKLSQLSDPSDKCSICLEEFEKEEHVRVLFCKHFFHKGCIDTWLTENNTTCPLCRSDTRDEPNNENHNDNSNTNTLNITDNPDPATALSRSLAQ